MSSRAQPFSRTQNGEDTERRRHGRHRPFYATCNPASRSLDTPDSCTRTIDYHSLHEYLPLPLPRLIGSAADPCYSVAFLSPLVCRPGHLTATARAAGTIATTVTVLRGYCSSQPVLLATDQLQEVKVPLLMEFSCSYSGAYPFEMAILCDSNTFLYCSDSNSLYKPRLSSSYFFLVRSVLGILKVEALSYLQIQPRAAYQPCRLGS